MNIVLIVPTKDRPFDLDRLLSSIAAQTKAPYEVIIVDGSDRPIKNVVDKFASTLKINYLPCRPPSLPKQRNLGISAIPDKADWIGFLDDDLVLEKDALEKLDITIKRQNNSKLKGVSLCILNQQTSLVASFNHFFLLGGKRPGAISKAGFPVAIPCAQKDLKTEWLYGGATFWAKDILDNFKFDEWFFGTGYMEDIDFSYRVSRKYDLMVSADAKCNHYHHQISLKKESSIGEWQLTSWWYFITKHKDFNSIFIWWGILGLVLKNILAIFYFKKKTYILRAIGHYRGLIKIYNGTATDLKGFVK